MTNEQLREMAVAARDSDRIQVDGITPEMLLVLVNDLDKKEGDWEALEKAVEGHPICDQCGALPAVCYGRYEGHGKVAWACDRCCGHGNEDGWCEPIGKAAHAIHELMEEMDKAIEKWEALEAAAGNLCAHCRAVMPIEDIPAHLRTCAKSPLALENQKLREGLKRIAHHLRAKSGEIDGYVIDGFADAAQMAIEILEDNPMPHNVRMALEDKSHG